jgi:ABC-2 type transport system permease protein
MLANVFTLSLRRRARSTALLVLALAAVSLLYLGVFPAIEDSMAAYIESVPETMVAFLGGADMSQAPGYLQSTVFGVFGPLVVAGAAISWGASAIAGEEGDHTLALLLSAPVSRRRVALQKLGAIVVALTALLAALLLVLLALRAAYGLAIPTAGIAAGVLHLYGLGLLAAGLGFGVGAATGRRSLAVAVAAGVLVGGFAFSGAAGPVEALQPLLWLSPYHWYNGGTPVEDGVGWGSVALLLSFAILAAVVGLLRFERRDLAV